MTVPNFLIIGGMKCGSTTLYRDLITQPGVFMPDDKEPHSLADDAVLTADGRDAYERLFAAAGSATAIGEASTGYTKMPDMTGCAPRARDVCGSDLRLVYMIREPVARLLSHHQHEVTGGTMPADLGRAITECDRLIGYSRYFTQAEPWIETFGGTALRTLRLEDVRKSRRETVEALAPHLGFNADPDRVNAEKVFNKGENKPVVKGGWRAIQGNILYVKLVRPLMSTAVREKIRTAILPKAKTSKQAASADLIDRVYDALDDDMARIGDLMGLGGPAYTREDARRAHGID